MNLILIKLARSVYYFCFAVSMFSRYEMNGRREKAKKMHIVTVALAIEY